MSNAPGTDGRRPRRGEVLDEDSGPAFFTSDLDGAPRWVGGMLAGLQAALLSLLVVALPAIAAFVATSSTVSTGDTPWTQAVRTGTGLWLLAHGVPLASAPSVTLAPLGLTAVAVFLAYASARRSGYATRSALLAGVGAYTAVLVVACLATGVPLLHTGAGVLGAVATATLGLGAGLLRRPEAPSLTQVLAPVRDRLPEPVAVGLRAGAITVAALVAVAALVTTVWVVDGRSTVTEVADGLGADTVGSLVLAVAELAYLPTLVLWAMSWVAGPGFAVGTGTSFSVAEAQVGALPAVPLLGALPEPDVAGGLVQVAPVLVVATGVLAGAWAHRRLPSTRAWHPLVATLVCASTAGVLVLTLAALAAGGIGPERMQHLGPQAALVAGAVAVEVLVGAALVLLPGDRHVRAAVVAGARRVLRRPAGQPPGDS